MNKTININLGGFPFTVDDEAFQILKDYIDKVEKYFKNSEGSEEITADIEYRLAELIRSKMGARKIVMVSDVRSSIQILGTPEMFGEESYTDDNSSKEEAKSGKFEDFQTFEKETYSTGKKLFRNSENQIVAGVCSGLAAYFGINDPVWIRLIFALTVISGGMGVVAYLVMWAIIPEAKNSADRLAMKGKSINISNIAKEVESQVNNLSKKFSSLGKTKTPGSTSGFDHFEKDTYTDFAGGIEELGHKFGDFIRRIVLGILRVLKSIGRGIAIFLLIIVGIVWIAALFSIFYSKSALLMILPFGMVGSLSYAILVLLLLIIPLILLGLWVAGVFRYSHSRKKILGYSSLLWFLALFITALSTVSWMKNFKEEGIVVENKSYELESDTLAVKFAPFNFSGTRISFGTIAIMDDDIVSSKIQINMAISKDDKVYVSQTVRSHGKTKENAKVNAGYPVYNYQVVDNTLIFDKEFKIPAKGQHRNQRIVIDIEVPSGMVVNIEPNMVRNIYNIQFSDKEKSSKDIQKTRQLKATEAGFEVL